MEEFNRGIYDYIIATDEASSFQSVREARKNKKKTHGKRKRDKEYGVARGIDFKGAIATTCTIELIKPYRHIKKLIAFDP